MSNPKETFEANFMKTEELLRTTVNFLNVLHANNEAIESAILPRLEAIKVEMLRMNSETKPSYANNDAYTEMLNTIQKDLKQVADTVRQATGSI